MSVSCVSADVRSITNFYTEDMKRDRAEQIAEAFVELDRVKEAAWERGDLRSVLKCIDMKLRVPGAYKPDAVVVPVQSLDWNALLAPNPTELKLKEVENANGDHS